MARLAGLLAASAVILAVTANVGCSSGPAVSRADPVKESTASPGPAPERGVVSMYQAPT
jgi:hypothetical protein